MARRWLKRLFLFVAAVALLALGWDRLLGIYRVERNDLEIEFVVADAETGS